MIKHAESESERIRNCLARARAEIEICVTLQDALYRVVTVSVETLQALRGSISLKNVETGHLDICAKYDPDLDPLGTNRQYFELGKGIAGRAALTGMPYCWNGDLQDANFDPPPSDRIVYSILAAPIQAHGVVIGVLCIEGPEHNFFSTEDQDLLVRLAEQAASVIERSLFLETLIQLGQSAIGLPLDEMLQHMARQVSMLMEKSICTIELQSRSNGKHCIKARSPNHHIAQTETPLRLSAPLVSLQEGNIGNVQIFGPDEFSPWQQNLFSAFIKHANITIENARLLEKNQKYVNILQTLHMMTEQVTEVLQKQGEEAVLNLIAEHSSQVLGTDVLTIYPYQETQQTFATPPICLGEIGYPEYLDGQVYPDDLPMRILEAPVRYHYWPQAAQSELLAREMRPRDAQTQTHERFVIRENIASAAAVGLVAGDKPVGVVFFSFREPQEFGSEQRWMIEAFANYMALALETLASHRQIRASASREEAERWNRELHDSVLQVLAGGVLAKAGVIKSQLRRQDYNRAMENLERLEKAAQYVYNEVQGIRAELTDRKLTRKGLLAALQDYIGFRQEQGAVEPIEARDLHKGLEIEFIYDDLGALPPETEHNLYRIAQEALSNALKSAHADRVRVSLRKDAVGIWLSIEDNGCGFDVEAALPQSFGLIGMCTRARAIGGYLKIDSRPGAGTCITAIIPFDAKEAESYGSAH